MTRRNLTFDQTVLYVGYYIAGRRNCQTSQLGRAPPYGEKVLDAAIQRNDHEIEMRMLSNTDLFAMDSKYHRSCYSHYISLNSIKTASARDKVDKSDNARAFKSLCKEIEETAPSKTTPITTLSVLNERLVRYVRRGQL